MPLLLSFLLPTLTYGAAAVAVYAFGATIASGIIWIGATILGVVAMLFDTLILYTVVNFHTFIYPAIQDGINITWTVGRDISNIVIIGVFTYVGISTILGGQSFGAKSLMARVLIIAMLINFSLFFTQAIIFTSNFVASKFYYATVPSTTGAATSNTSLPTEETQAGIAGRFMELAGLPSLSRAGETTQAIREQHDYGFWMALLYGFSVFTMCIAFAGVLFYAVILLLGRTVLFLILLATSSFAFGTHLIPKVSDNYGWSMWWNTLFRNAIFAPILLIMLWGTFQIAESFVKTQGSTRSFDKLFLGQGDASGILALFFYFIVLGMLYASIRLSNMVAMQLPGFKWAPTIAALPLTLSSQYGIAPAGRRFLGRPALERQMALEKEIKDAKASGNWSAAIKAQEKYNALNARAKSDFNPMNAKSSQWLAKQLGVSGFTGAQKIGGAAAQQKAAIKEAVENVGKLKLSKDDLGDIKKKEVEKARQASEVTLKNAESDRKLADEKRKNIEAERRQIEEDHKNEEKRVKDTMHREVQEDQQMKQLKQQLANETDPTAQKSIQQNMRQRQSAIEQEHVETMREVQNKIETARTAVNTRLAEVQAEWDAHNLAVKDIESSIETSGKKAVEAAEEGFRGAVKEMLPSGYQSEKMVKKVEAEIGSARLKEKLKLMVDDVKGDDANEEKKAK